MKKSIRWYLVWGAMVACITMLTLVLTTGPASAWTQEKNPFSDTGSGTGFCGQTSSYPCLYWQEPHYTSITLTLFMDPSLTSQSRGYDFPTAIQGAFAQYNNVPAWNPYMSECFNFCQVTQGDYYMTLLPCPVYGETTPSGDQNIKYGQNADGGYEYYAFVSFANVKFNSNVTWNNSDTYSSNCSDLRADGRAVALHESGHVQNLGHTGDCPSIMNDSCYQLNHLHTLSSNSDIPAVEGIYPGNQQSS
jgi:hypothetical protein